MSAAAAIAAAFVAPNPLFIRVTALQFTPRRSRFLHGVSDCLAEVSKTTDWLDGYGRIHNKYKLYGHCHIYPECGSLINTLRFAETVDDGSCKRVSQGNDTDSFGATAGLLANEYRSFV